MLHHLHQHEQELWVAELLGGESVVGQTGLGDGCEHLLVEVHLEFLE